MIKKKIFPLALVLGSLGLITIFLTSNLEFNVENVKISNSKRIEHRVKNEKNLVIFNCADYIDESLIDEFEELYDCNVSYYTYDTNETMYNQFNLDRDGYDLICASDYMLQRMIRENLVDPINIEEELPIYSQYAATEVRQKLKSMPVEVTNENNVKEIKSLDDYVAGYMWGTLGIIYDSECSETIRNDVKSWDVFWDNKYEDLISIKNSMRDTFVVGLMHAYKELPLRDEKDLSEDEKTFVEICSKLDTSDETELVQSIFDLVITAKEDTQAIINVVQNQLISLKKNIFGFEVDSGKNDIITGKIKMNLAWSGDAVYSIDEAAGRKKLEYSVPDEGSNVWYDGWTLPKGANRDLALKFIEFLSLPENAARNMNEVGYTSFIASDSVFDLVTEWYGIGEYNDSTEYHGSYVENEDGENVEYEGSIVYYQGDFYQNICEDEGPYVGIKPTDSTCWEKVDKEELDLAEPFDIGYLFDESERSYVIYPYAECANQLETQYPTQETLKRCAVMKDFESANEAVIIMWGQVRAYSSMLPYYIILITTVVLGVGVLVFYKVKKKTSYRYHRKKD